MSDIGENDSTEPKAGEPGHPDYDPIMHADPVDSRNTWIIKHCSPTRRIPLVSRKSRKHHKPLTAEQEEHEREFWSLDMPDTPIPIVRNPRSKRKLFDSPQHHDENISLTEIEDIETFTDDDDDDGGKENEKENDVNPPPPASKRHKRNTSCRRPMPRFVWSSIDGSWRGD
jgi:hypothetical protein